MTASPAPAGESATADEPLEHHRVDRVRGGLEVLPRQEQPHRVEPARGDPGEVGRDLGRIEARPPGHRGARRPVVDAEPEARADRRGSAPVIGAPRAIERHDPPVDGEVLVHHPLDVEALLDRRAHRGAGPAPPQRRPRRPPRRANRRGSRSRRRGSSRASSRGAGDHRGAAGHRLDDAEAERLVEVDEVQQRARATQQFAAAPRGRPGPRYVTRSPSSAGFDEPLEVLLVLDDPGDQRAACPRGRATSIASAAPLSGWIRPKNSR